MATEDGNDQTGSEDAELSSDEEGALTIPEEEEAQDEGEKLGEQRLTREEKKRNRPREFEQRAIEAERRAQEAERVAARLEGAVSALAQRGGGGGNQPGAQGDPLQTEYDTVVEQQAQLADAIQALSEAGKLTPEMRKRYFEEAKALDLKSKRLVVRMEQRDSLRNAPPPEYQQQQAVRMQLESEFSDVYMNPSALQWAKGRVEMIIARRGQPANAVAQLAIVREALKEAAAEFGMRRDPVSDAQKRKYGSVGRSAGGTGANGDRPGPTTIPGLSPARAQKMADALFKSEKDPKKRLDMWKKGPGRKLAQELRTGEES